MSPPATRTIKLTTSFPKWPLAGQTPGGSARWQEFQFVIDRSVTECDAWIVYDGLGQAEMTHCPEENLVFVTAEPPAYKRYNPAWLQSFAHVISCQRDIPHPHVHLSQTSLPWWCGRTYDDLAGKPFPPKSRFLSVISSAKSTTRGHRQRLKFVRQLQAALPGIDVFGRGIRPLQSKWDGLAEYRYSLAIENCVYPDYWTEKIGDCFLAGTVPLYHGCPNIAEYFPADAFEILPIQNVDEAIRRIRALEHADFARREAALNEAKERVLHHYNLFNLLSEFCRTLKLDAPRRETRLSPEPSPGYLGRKLEKWRRRWLT